METADSGTRANREEFLSVVADQITERESANGCPWSDGPTAAEFRDLCPQLLSAGQSGRPGYTPTEIWALMNAIATVSDKWVDPDNDPIGRLIQPMLEQIIENLGRTLDIALPDTAAKRIQWTNLRVATHCIERRIRYEAAHPSMLQTLRRRLLAAFKRNSE